MTPPPLGARLLLGQTLGRYLRRLLNRRFDFLYTKKTARAGAVLTLRLTLFPNNELRVRIQPPAPSFKEGTPEVFAGTVPESILSIAQNLRLDSPDAIKPKREQKGDPPGYGAKPKGVRFSRRARRLIVRSGGLVGVGGYRNSVLFLTGTLPGSTVEALDAIAKYSSWVVHSLLTRIPRAAGCSALECRWIWCWEFQKRGALHWHCVLQLPSVEARRRVEREFTPLWNSTLRGVANKSGVDIFAREGGGTWKDQPGVWRSSAEKLRKRADRYLAKYLSKGSGPGAAEEFPPTRWYGISRLLHRELADSTMHANTRKQSERHVFDEREEGILRQLESISTVNFSYCDKVGMGINFVFYLKEDSGMNEAKKIFGEIARTYEYERELIDVRFDVGQYQALAAVSSRPHILERFLNDLGDYYRRVYYRWKDEDPKLEETEVFWLEYYARRLCFVAGVSYRGQPPERSGAGLPSRDSTKMENSPPPIPELEQTSLFP